MGFDFLNKSGILGKVHPILSAVPVQDIFEMLSSLVNCRMGLHDLADLHSDKIDELILQEERNKNEYVGGIFNIMLINEAYMELSYEMYFRGTSGQYMKKEAKSKPIKVSYLDDEAIKILNDQEDKKISFDINPPAKNTAGVL